jgi:hypothetical protein
MPDGTKGSGNKFSSHNFKRTRRSMSAIPTEICIEPFRPGLGKHEPSDLDLGADFPEGLCDFTRDMVRFQRQGREEQTTTRAISKTSRSSQAPGTIRKEASDVDLWAVIEGRANKTMQTHTTTTTTVEETCMLQSHSSCHDPNTRRTSSLSPVRNRSNDQLKSQSCHTPSHKALWKERQLQRRVVDAQHFTPTTRGHSRHEDRLLQAKACFDAMMEQENPRVRECHANNKIQQHEINIQNDIKTSETWWKPSRHRRRNL